MWFKIIGILIFVFALQSKCAWGQTWHVSGIVEDNYLEIEQAVKKISGVANVKADKQKELLIVVAKPDASIQEEDVMKALKSFQGVILGQRLSSIPERHLSPPAPKPDFPPEKISGKVPATNKPSK